MLLNVPPEILDLILSFLDPPAFSLVLLSNKVLRQRILSSSQALHSQLRAVPHVHNCQTLLCKSEGSAQLLNLFNKRAAAHCMNGISVLCDAVSYTPSFRPRYKLAQIARFEGNHDPTELAAIPELDTGKVHIYSMNQGFPVGRFLIDPVMLHPALANFEIVLLKLHEQSSKRHVTMLYRYSSLKDPSLDETLKFKNSLIYEAQNSRVQKLVLLTCTITPSDGVTVVSVRDISIGRRYKPVSMEVSSTGQCLIVFKLDSGLYRIKAYHSPSNSLQVYQPVPHSYTIHAGTGISSTRDCDKNSVVKLDEPIFAVSLSENKTLRLFTSADQMPAYQINNCFDVNSLIEPLTQPTISNSEAFFGSYRWRPLGSGHKHKCVTDDSGTKCCVSSVRARLNLKYIATLTSTQILQLAFIKCSVKKPRKYSETKCLLIKGSVSSDDCAELDLEKPFPSLEHEVVGILDGIDMQTEILHGHVVAVSKKRNRIAIATWNRVFLYAINPSAFLTASVGSLTKLEGRKPKRSRRQSLQFSNRSREFADEEDHSYSQNCGLGYYRDYVKFYKKRIARLTPIELPSKGVVHKLHFVGKDALWAWTDRGLVKWHWAPARTQQTRRGPERVKQGLRDERELPTVSMQSNAPLGKGVDLKPKCWIMENLMEDMDWQQDVV
jgi:hypothetical protein